MRSLSESLTSKVNQYCAACGIPCVDKNIEFVICGRNGKRYKKCLDCYDAGKPARSFIQLDLFDYVR